VNDFDPADHKEEPLYEQRDCKAFAPYEDGPAQARGSERFHELLKQIGDLHDKKQRDYGSQQDPLANVRAGAEWNVEPWVAAMVRGNDKVRRLQQYARTGSLANEGVQDSFMDLAVYALIALVLWEEGSAVQKGE
jgi:hypothetical protein